MERTTPSAFYQRPPAMLVLDVDGVLTDNAIIFDADGREAKRFHVPDGAGIRWLLDCDIEVAWISGRRSAVVKTRARELGVDEVHLGVREKGPLLQSILASKQIEAADVVYVGDDLIDLAPMALVGLPVAVANAREEVRAAAVAVTCHPGGEGAVREVAEWILNAHDKWSGILAEYAPGVQG